MAAERAIGVRLAALRSRRGLTQERLAERAGVSVDLIKKLEQGQRRSARMSSLAALAAALEVATADLVGEPRRHRGQQVELTAAAVSGMAGAVSVTVRCELRPAQVADLIEQLYAAQGGAR
jgi:transcriptional regulator with XRE-family HTH domain